MLEALEFRELCGGSSVTVETDCQELFDRVRGLKLVGCKRDSEDVV